MSIPAFVPGPTGKTFLDVRDPEGFWRRVDRTDPEKCWVWRGYCGREGYGIVGVRGKNVKAHRVAWRLATGQDPGVSCVLHRCDNRKCMNPGHLFLGTQQDNINDMVAKERHNSGTRALTLEQAIRIRREVRAFEKDVAGRYGVSHFVVRSIMRGRTWRRAQ